MTYTHDLKTEPSLFDQSSDLEPFVTLLPVINVGLQVDEGDAKIEVVARLVLE